MCKLQQKNLWKSHFESINIFIPLLSHQVCDGNTQVTKKIGIAYGPNNVEIATPKFFLKFAVTKPDF